MKKIKYVFKDAFAPHVGTCTCANLLQDTLIEDGSDIRVNWCSIPHPSQRYRKNKIYEMDDFGNIILKDAATKLLQKKVHPREGEGFGLHYVYTYDKIPTDEQLSNSFLVYVCCEEVEFEDPKDTLIKLPPGKSKNVQWQSKNKGGSIRVNPKKVSATKFFGNTWYKKIEESGFTRLNTPKKDVKPSIIDIQKKNDEV
jgi:hypothetical protein